MQLRTLLLCTVLCCGALSSLAGAQLITDPPRNTTIALGTNATFTCRGNGEIMWEISNTQIQEEVQLAPFAAAGIYPSLPTQGFSELIMTGTTGNNVTRDIKCLVSSDPNNPLVDEESGVVRLLVYAEPYPPSDLVIEVDGLNLVVTWTEPFSLQGEEISYVVSITNMATRENREFIVNTTSYVFTEPFGDQRNCEEYEFSVFSMNGFSKSMNGISGRRFIPTAPLLLTPSDVQISVSLSTGARATVTFSSRDPCSTYPVTLYNFTIAERGTNDSLVSIQHNSDASLILDNANAGLLPNRVYSLFIEAENSVGSTLSEEIILYTTGLQSSSAVMELDGSITVTCTFATGASSTGCQVTIFNTDNTQVEILSENINRQNENTNMVTGSFNLLKSNGPEVVTLLVEVSEMQAGGEITDALFNLSLPFNNTPSEVILPVRNAAGGVSSSVIGAVVSVAVMFVIIVVLILIIIFIVIRHRSTRRTPVCIPEALSIDHLELKPNDTYGINLRSLSMSHPDHSHYDTPRPQLAAAAVNSTDGACTVVDDIKPKPNEVYGVNRESLLKLKIDWNSEGAGDDQSDAHYSYVGMERTTAAVYDTIDSRRPSNKYVKS